MTATIYALLSELTEQHNVQFDPATVRKAIASDITEENNEVFCKLMKDYFSGVYDNHPRALAAEIVWLLL